MSNYLTFTLSVLLACLAGFLLGKLVGKVFELAFGTVTVINYKGEKVRVMSKDEHLAPLVVAIIQELVQQRVKEGIKR